MVVYEISVVQQKENLSQRSMLLELHKESNSTLERSRVLEEDAGVEDVAEDVAEEEEEGGIGINR